MKNARIRVTTGRTPQDGTPAAVVHASQPVNMLTLEEAKRLRTLLNHAIWQLEREETTSEPLTTIINRMRNRSAAC
jgi:hypothetical protein